ncbi:hypothetical protein ACJD0Z_18665 [Flavobacteriaceae bacterium M23B6Z8]
MRKFRIVLFSSLVFCLGTLCGQDLSKIPSDSTYIFKETRELIVSKEIYQDSLFKRKVLLKKSLRDAALDQLGAEMDSIQIDEYLDLMIGQMLLTNYDAIKLLGDTKKYIYKFKDSRLITYVMLNDKVIGDLTKIDRTNNRTLTIPKKDTVITISADPYKFTNNSYTTIQEFPEDVRTIKGKSCFRVEGISKTVLDSRIPVQVTRKHIMYVTKEISLKYHPIIKDLSILTSYYPLEIVETSNFNPGMIYKYSLQIIH